MPDEVVHHINKRDSTKPTAKVARIYDHSESMLVAIEQTVLTELSNYSVSHSQNALLWQCGMPDEVVHHINKRDSTKPTAKVARIYDHSESMLVATEQTVLTELSNYSASHSQNALLWQCGMPDEVVHPLSLLCY